VLLFFAIVKVRRVRCPSSGHDSIRHQPQRKASRQCSEAGHTLHKVVSHLWFVEAVTAIEAEVIEREE